MNFEKKYYKYKSKYLNLITSNSTINQKGGNLPEWYAEFEIDLLKLNESLKGEFPSYAFTGSGAIAYLAKTMNKLELLRLLPKPNDFDLLAVSLPIRTDLFGYSKKQKTEEKSQSFEKQIIIYDSEKKPIGVKVKSFDITTGPTISRRLFVNGIPIIMPDIILNIYNSEKRAEKILEDNIKKAILKELIKYLQEETYTNIIKEEEKKSRFEMMMEEEAKKTSNDEESIGSNVKKSLFF